MQAPHKTKDNDPDPTARAQELSRLRADFKTIFRNPDTKALTVAGRNVLAYLRKFSYWASTLYRGDPYQMAYLDGRRSMYLEIQRVLNLTDEQIFTVHQVGVSDDDDTATG